MNKEICWYLREKETGDFLMGGLRFYTKLEMINEWNKLFPTNNKRVYKKFGEVKKLYY